MNSALQRLGRIDVLVNNAAIYADTTLTGGSYESQTHAYERSIDICAMGSFYCATAAAAAMRAVGGGEILNVITEHIKEGHLMTGGAASGYDCAKWVQWRQVETWAIELAEHNIRVNGLCMGGDGHAHAARRLGSGSGSRDARLGRGAGGHQHSFPRRRWPHGRDVRLRNLGHATRPESRTDRGAGAGLRIPTPDR